MKHESVFIRDNRKPGIILSENITTRSDKVETDDGIIRRNRRHLIPLPQSATNRQDDQVTDHGGRVCEHERVSASEPAPSGIINNDVMQDSEQQSQKEHYYTTSSGRISKPPDRLMYN